MKKSVTYALVILLCLTVQGCAGQTKESETQPSTQMELELEVETLKEAETESETEEETTEAEEDLQVKTIIGSLVDIDMNQITVLSDNGNEIILPIREAELDFNGGFRVGNLVSVSYAGEIRETDNLEADITVLRAADSSDVQELKISAPRAETENESSTEGGEDAEDESGTESGEDAEDESGTEGGEDAEGESGTEEVKTIRGKIQRMEQNSMTILTDEKEEKTFGIMNVRMYFAKGMGKGTKVVISYTGEFSEEGGKVLSVIDAASFPKLGQKEAPDAGRETESTEAGTGKKDSPENGTGAESETDTKKESE